MNKLFQIGLIALVSLAIISCGGPAGEKADASDAKDVKGSTTATTDYAVNTTTSIVNWTGSKAGGEHSGTIRVQSGNLQVDAAGNITGGEFIIDMASLTNTDMEGQMKEKLEGHLKSADFFDAGKFPTAKFVITEVMQEMNDSKVSGNLTLKGVTKNITFGAAIENAGDNITAKAPAFKINRTDWNVHYGSKKKFADLAADKIISDEIALTITLAAAKNEVVQ